MIWTNESVQAQHSVPEIMVNYETESEEEWFGWYADVLLMQQLL
jgi:hypothetical protein